LSAQQGEIYELDGSLWIVVDHYYCSDRYSTVHCAPCLTSEELRLQLDVPINVPLPVEELRLGPDALFGIQGTFASLMLMERVEKRRLTRLQAVAQRVEVEQIRRNLVTWFSYYTFVDLDSSAPGTPAPDKPPVVEPGMILTYKRERVCVTDHWGCFNEYPLLYVAPVVPDLPTPNPLDVEISSQLRDLFSSSYYVRPGEFFSVEREILEGACTPQTPQLSHGLGHRISRSMALKFGQLGLLL
jgi:hypothetical protein